MVQVLLTAAVAASVWFDFVPSLGKRTKRESWVYAVLLAISYVILIAASLGWWSPNLFTPVHLWIERLS